MLTAMQQTVWELATGNLKRREIAKKLGISPATVSVHLKVAKKKLTEVGTDEKVNTVDAAEFVTTGEVFIETKSEYGPTGRQQMLSDLATGTPHLKRFASIQQRQMIALPPSLPGAGWRDPDNSALLTPREQEIWDIRNHKYSEIAKRLKISTSAVRSHMLNIRRKQTGGFIPQASVKELGAAAESAGFMKKELWAGRGKCLRIFAKGRTHRMFREESDGRIVQHGSPVPTHNTVAIRVQKKDRDNPHLAGKTPVRILPEGDATYILTKAEWEEVIYTRVIDKISASI